MESGIYKIQSICKPERCYIGSAKNIKNREYIHLYELSRGSHHSPQLQRHYNKYGKDDLLFTVVCYCSIPELLSKEQEYLDLMNPYFNSCMVAGNRSGFRASEETREKLRQSHKGQKPWTTGKHRSAETKLKISIALKGRKIGPLSEETKLKLSMVKKGKVKGPMSDSAKEKIGAALKAHWASKKCSV